jgi:hypothetical protein
MSSRVVALIPALMVCAACSRASAPPAPPPSAVPPPFPTATESIAITETIEMRPRPRGAVPDTGPAAEARAAAWARAEVAARLVDTIVATPDTIALEAGESVFFSNVVRLSARDSMGAPVSGMAPLVSVADQNVARFQGGELIGVSVGRTVLRVGPAVPGGASGVRPRTRTEIPVVVRPARTASAIAPVDSVPRDLVVALLSGGTRPVSLRVEAVADGLSEELFRDSRVLGSAHVGNSATTAVVMPFSARVVLDTLDARLAAAGWRPPRPPQPQMRGFLPSPAALGGFGPGHACRTGEYLSSVARARSPNETLVVLFQRRATGPYGPCADSTSTARRNPMDEFPVPLLYGPPDVELEPGGNSFSGNSWEIEASLRGRTPLADVLEHFAAQLRKQNWTATDSSTARGVAMQTFRHVGTDGKRWLGVLSIVVPGDAFPRQVSFRIRRLEP